MHYNLRLIGYWKSPFELKYEHPITFVDDSWNKEERKAVVNYLKNGKAMPYVAMGLSFCRFDCGIGGNGCLEKTDGIYLWPEGLAHYVEFHNVKLPEEFIIHCLNNKEIKEVNIEDEFEISEDWWVLQKGPNQELLEEFGDPFEEDYPVIHRILFREEKIKLNKTAFLNFTKQFSQVILEEVVEVYKKIKKENSLEINLDNKQLENIHNLRYSNLFIDDIVQVRLKNE